MRVLLADDETHITEGLIRLVDWERMGVQQVDVAADGAEALALYRLNKPDLIVTDITMPGMTGLEFLERVRKTDEDTPAVILSGYDEFEYAQKALRLRALHYLMKPIVLEEIEHVLHDILQKASQETMRKQLAEQFANTVKRQLPALRERFLYDLITIGARTREVLPEQLAFYELDEDVARGAALASLRLYRTDLRRAESERDWQLFKFSALNIVEETLQSEGGGKAYALPFVEDRLPILVCGSDGEETEKLARSLAGTLIRNLGRYISVEANAGIGSWYDRPELYALSYKESQDALRHAENEGFQLVLSASDAEVSEPGAPAYPDELVRLLGRALREGRREDALQLWDDTEAFLRRRYAEPQWARVAAVAMIGSLNAYFMESGVRLAETEDWRPLRVLQELEAAKAREEMLELLRSYVARAADTLHAGRTAGNEYVQKALRIVEERYASSLTISQVCAELHLSRNYLGYLFKRETGLSFIQYLTKVRIERAIEMMKTRRYLIAEVSEKVGFSDPAYFSRVFRGSTGKSPLEFVSALE